MKSQIKILIKAMLGLFISVVLVGIYLIFSLTITEYKPEEKEKIEIKNISGKSIEKGQKISLLTWNVGYGALGDYADFFMDGGTKVTTSTEAQVNQNIKKIASDIGKMNPDIIFLQEVDVKSKRSYGIDERAYLSSRLPEMEHTFAYNFKTMYVPYPVPAIGEVGSGILTFSKYHTIASTRVKLPCPFTYPTRIANLKRCLMVNRMKIKGSNKELVLVNLHLEAYDSGEGKAVQTKMLKEILEKEESAGNYVIAGGDFNQTFSNVDHSVYPVISKDMWKAGKIEIADFSDALSFYMDTKVPSCRSLDRPLQKNETNKFQYYIIDGFIVSSNLKMNKVETKDFQFKNTDHNPVYMEVTLH